MIIQRLADAGVWMHWCPACQQTHPLPDRWHFNGDVKKPTFAPSFRQGFVRWSGGIDKDGIGQGERQNVECHYIITDGRLHYCADSWHGRSDVVDMPEIPEDERW